MDYFPLLLFGGAGAVFGLAAGSVVGIDRYREALALGFASFVATFVTWAVFSSADEKWGWAGVFLFANVLSYSVFLGFGCAARGLLNRVTAS
jgi:hypothetical protein